MSISVKEICGNLVQIMASEKDRKAYSGFLLLEGTDAALIGTVPGHVLDEWITSVKEIAENRKSSVRYIAVFSAAEAREGFDRIREAFPQARMVSSDGICFEIAGAPLQDKGSLVSIRGCRKLPLGERTLTCVSISGKEGRSFCLKSAGGRIFTAGEYGVEQREEKPDAAADRDIRVYRDMKPGKAEKTTERKPAPKQPLKVCIPYTQELYIPELAGAISRGLEDAFESGGVKVSMLCLNEEGSLREIRKKLEEADVIVPGCFPVQGEVRGLMRSMMDLFKAGDLSGKRGTYFAAVRGSGQSAEGIGKEMLKAGIDVLDAGFTIFGRLTMQDLQNAEDFGFNAGCMLQQKMNPRGSRLVKCIVCGEIFDASLGICPVCGAGLDQCVPVSGDEITYRNDTDREYLILGGGCAAVSAADAIRMRDKTGRITIVMEEEYLPVNRPMLTKDLNAAAHADQIQLHPADWYEKRDISVITGVLAEKICPEEKKVICSDGIERRYDRLIYALGSESFVPPFSGAEHSGVLTVRHVEDARKMKEHMFRAKEAVIIGGGVLGLEAAYELWRRGLKITVLEATPQLIGRSVNAATAQTVRDRMQRMGVTSITSASIDGMISDEQGHVSGVRLKDGTEYPAQLVIISCGSRANTALAKEAGIVTDRAVIVNAAMETSIPGIYACGDCAQLDGVNYQLWSEAGMQGKAAGANAAGDNIRCVNIPPALSMDAFGMQLFSIGDVGKTEGEVYQTVRTEDGVSGKQRTWWLRAGTVSGVTAIGYPEDTDIMQNAVLSRISYGELIHLSIFI